MNQQYCSFTFLQNQAIPLDFARNLESLRILRQYAPQGVCPCVILTAIGALEGVGLGSALRDTRIAKRRQRALVQWAQRVPANETWVLPCYDVQSQVQYAVVRTGRVEMLRRQDWVQWWKETGCSLSVTLDHAWTYPDSQKLQYASVSTDVVLRTLTVNIPSLWVGASVYPGGHLPLTQVGWMTWDGATWYASSQQTQETLYDVLVWCIRTYVQSVAAKGIVLGLSGGVDSALILALACDAIGSENVKAIMMPTRYTSSMSLEDAERIAQNFGVQYRVLPIEEVFASFLKVLHPILQDAPWDVTEENLQARIRGTMLMACSNKENRLLLCTTNKAEAAMGYGTLYGDLTGGLAPLLDLWKSQVYQLCQERNCRSTKEMIPQRIMSRRPSAELRRNQRDSDSLPAYDWIEKVIVAYLRGDALDRNDASVQWILQRLVRHNFKRAQGIPGPVVSGEPLSALQRLGMTSRW